MSSLSIKQCAWTIACALILAHVPTSGHSEVANVFGPEVFVRDKGEPVVAVSEFSTDGFTGPYVLYLRNGDDNGRHRASSAEIWLNGQLLFDPSSFSQKVGGYDIDVNLVAQSRLEVRMASKPGAHLSIWIEGQPLAPHEKTIGPAGGVFAFPGGIELEVPPGAVSQPVNVGLSMADCGTLEDILNGRSLSTKPLKRCLASFVGTPSGLEFNLPILARLPVGQLASGNVPVLMDVDRSTASYRLLPTVIEYDGVLGVMQIELRGFSEKTPATYEFDPGTEFGPEWAAAGEEIKARCSSCGAQNDNNGANLPFCENLDRYQASCCLIPPAVRQLCAPNCYCCKEENARVVVTDVDFSSDECQLLGSTIRVTFPECPDAPTFEDSMEEASEECGDDTVWTITVDPPGAAIQACDEVRFAATISGASPDGSVAIGPKKLSALWVSSNRSVADFVDGDGLLAGKSRGSVDVEARISANNPIDAVGEAQVTVDSNIDSYTVDPANVSLRIGDEEMLVADVVAAEGVTPPPDPDDTIWSSTSSGAVSLTSAGAVAWVRGEDRGSATINAQLDFRCETVRAAAGVTVECRDVEFTLSDSALNLGIGESQPVSATATDRRDGSSLDVTGVSWQSGAETVVGIGNDVGPQTSVRGIQPTIVSPVPVTATYDDGCQTQEATVMVTVTCLELELSVEEGIVDIDAFLPIGVIAVNGRDETVPIDESSIQWSSSDPNIAAVIPSTGSLVNVIGISNGTVTITAEYLEGPCGMRRAEATISVGFGISGVWRLAPVTQFEECRYTPGDWWPEDSFTGFDVRIEQGAGVDDSTIVASYEPDVGLRLAGNWDRYTGLFDLAVDTTDPAQCGYLFFWDGGADLCGDAENCQFEACQITTNIEGQTAAPTGGEINSLDAASNWYYGVTFSFDTGSGSGRGETTWECQGNATLNGSRR